MTRASDLAKLLGAGATILDGTTISTADNTEQLTLTSTDADANAGPELLLDRNSSSPADADRVGKLTFKGRNDANQTVEYGNVQSRIIDASDGTEDGRIIIQNIIAGDVAGVMESDGTETIFNNNSKDLDFRVESNGNANMLFVDGGNDIVGIGVVPTAQFSHNIIQIGNQASLGANAALSTTGQTYLTHNLYYNTDGNLRVFNTSSANEGAILQMVDGILKFSNSSATTGTPTVEERLRVLSSGHVVIGKTVTTFSTAGTAFYPDGEVNFVKDNSTVVFINRLTSDGNLVQFHQAGTQEGSISISGTTTSYNGGHLSRWSQLADNTRDNTIVKGTVMTNLDQMAEWTTDGVTEDNEQLNCMAVSSVEGDANVAGVFVNWDNDDDVYTNDMNVAMTGDMVIRIAQGTTVARGDLLMSAGDGTAKPQDDDIVRSKTIAKVTSTNVSHTYDDGTYLVPCVIMAC
jgi:prepilin-type processing-associated H-X9-DG protein